MEKPPCLDHEKRISTNEAFISDIKKVMVEMGKQLKTITRAVWVGVGAVTAISIIFDTGIGRGLYNAFMKSASAYFGG